MLGASIPERTLNLHYRSRKESLIAFSNSRYYDDQLITFPAPIYPDKGVRLIRPDGFYSRGKARHNQGEAKAIVAEILRRLTHEDLSVREQSIGVVTFNSEQQTLIEDLLDQARSAHPHIEWAFAPDSGIEPVFVKNLETVQGDERDVIMFSVTYGPDQADHVTMNFGPLNRDGGERRLNVAITRSRSEMLVFSTLSPDHIDLSRTQARAVTDLKHFLEYAERGPAALGAAVHGSIGDFESPFETAVARALRGQGLGGAPAGRRIRLPHRSRNCPPRCARRILGWRGMRRRHVPQCRLCARARQDSPGRTRRTWLDVVPRLVDGLVDPPGQGHRHPSPGTHGATANR